MWVAVMENLTTDRPVPVATVKLLPSLLLLLHTHIAVDQPYMTIKRNCVAMERYSTRQTVADVAMVSSTIIQHRCVVLEPFTPKHQANRIAVVILVHMIPQHRYVAMAKLPTRRATQGIVVETRCMTTAPTPVVEIKL